MSPRERLKLAIALKDAARGHPLTDRERLENLEKALAEITFEESPHPQEITGNDV